MTKSTHYRHQRHWANRPATWRRNGSVGPDKSTPLSLPGAARMTGTTSARWNYERSHRILKFELHSEIKKKRHSENRTQNSEHQTTSWKWNDVSRNENILKTSCVGGRHNMPRPLQVDLWPFDLESGVWVVAYLCSNFSLPRHLCSRLRPDVRDRQTSDAHHSLMPLP